MPWEAAALQGSLAVVGRKGDSTFKELFACIDVRKSYGRVLLVGAGPGDAGLITVKGVNALKRCDVVFYDYLIDKKLLEYAPRAEKIYVGKRKGVHTFPQEKLNQLLRKHAQEGKEVVRLKGGDPMIFGRGADEIEYLRRYYIPVEVVPGVSSATAIPAIFGIPLTARDYSSSVAFLSGHEKAEDESHPNIIEIPKVDTVVFLMGLTKLDVILESLGAAKWRPETPVIVISKGTMEDEKVVVGTLDDIKKKVDDARLEPPALIIAGETVRFYQPREKYAQGILYTGTNPQKYSALENVLHFPMIEITPVTMELHKLQALVDKLHKYDFIMFTSRYAVKYFFEPFEQYDYKDFDLKKRKMIVIGKDTAEELKRHHYKPALVANVETSEGLYADIKKHFKVKDKRFLFPRSSVSNPYLKKNLEKAGARVDELVVYENNKPPKKSLPADGVNKVLFTSPSTVENFLKDYTKIPEGWKILSKGTRTQKALEEAGYKSEII